MLRIHSHAEGATLAVRAQPGARKDRVVGAHGDALKVAVSAPAADGRANAALAEVLSDWLGLKRSQVELASGRTTRNKVFLIRGITAEELTGLIASRLGEWPRETKEADA
jgi:uncharacterized protein (TIGR00251 family)